MYPGTLRSDKDEKQFEGKTEIDVIVTAYCKCVHSLLDAAEKGLLDLPGGAHLRDVDAITEYSSSDADGNYLNYLERQVNKRVNDGKSSQALNVVSTLIANSRLEKPCGRIDTSHFFHSRHKNETSSSDGCREKCGAYPL